MPIISDRDPVIKLAREILHAGESLSSLEAATLALRRHFHLAETDGIWSGSEAAVCMGFVEVPADTDLLSSIAADVASAIT